MGKENFGMLMGIYMRVKNTNKNIIIIIYKVSERMIKQMVKEYIITVMEQNMKAVGKMTYKMGLELKSETMDLDMKANIQWGKKKVRVLISGMMGRNM